MTSLAGPLWKSAVFVVTTVLATAVLTVTIRNGSSGPATEYHAVFAEAPSVNRGDDVRIHGVRVGQVTEVAVFEARQARVSFTVSDEVALSADVNAALKFRNLIGQRYVALEPGESSKTLEPGATIPLRHTRPALDLTQLFNGFQPLFRMLSPEDVNALSEQIIAVFQGEGSTVEGLVRHTGELASSLAERDQVIGRLITNLSAVMEVMGSRSDEVSDLVVTMQQLVSGLAQDRAALGEAVVAMGDLTTSMAGLLAEGRAPLRDSIADLGQLAGNLAAAEDTLDTTFERLPLKLERLGRTTSYGSWVNFYLCEVTGPIPDVEGYAGDRGVRPTAGRCA